MYNTDSWNNLVNNSVKKLNEDEIEFKKLTNGRQLEIVKSKMEKRKMAKPPTFDLKKKSY